MRGLVGFIMAAIAIVFVGAAFYYWGGMRKPSSEPVEGVVVDKVARIPGTEAGDKPLGQGLRALSGQSMSVERFFVLMIRTESGDVREMTVSQAFFQQAGIGDTVRQEEPGGPARVVMRAARPPWGAQQMRHQQMQPRPMQRRR